MTDGCGMMRRKVLMYERRERRREELASEIRRQLLEGRNGGYIPLYDLDCTTFRIEEIDGENGRVAGGSLSSEQLLMVFAGPQSDTKRSTQW